MNFVVGPGINPRFNVEHEDDRRGKIVVNSQSIALAGSSYNVYRWLQRCGQKPYLVGIVGNDQLGDMVETMVRGQDMNAFLPMPKLRQATPTSYSFASSDHRSFYSFKPNYGNIEPETLERLNKELESRLRGCPIRARIATGITSQDFELVARVLFRTGECNVLNPRGDLLKPESAEVLKALLRQTNILCVSREDLLPYHNIDRSTLQSDLKLGLLADLHSLGPKIIAITLDSDGVILSSTEGNEWEIVHDPTMSIGRVINTVGAGDAFLSGLIVSVLRHSSLKKSAYFASFLAALACTKEGIWQDLTSQENRLLQLRLQFLP